MLRPAMAVLLFTVVASAQTQILELPIVSGLYVSGECTASGGVPRIQPKPDAFTQQDYVELARGSCFGNCPAYRVRIYRTGQVEWEGRHAVESAGKAEGQADLPETAEIFKQAASKEFWSACDSYDRMVTDVATYAVTASIGSETKSIEDHAKGGPDWVRQLMQKVDKAAGSQKWAGRDWSPIPVK